MPEVPSADAGTRADARPIPFLRRIRVGDLSMQTTFTYGEGNPRAT